MQAWPERLRPCSAPRNRTPLNGDGICASLICTSLLYKPLVKRNHGYFSLQNPLSLLTTLLEPAGCPLKPRLVASIFWTAMVGMFR